MSPPSVNKLNMANQDDELDFKSGRFNPARALSSADVPLPDPEAKEFDDLYSLRDTVHSQNFNVVREIPGVSEVLKWNIFFFIYNYCGSFF